MTATLSTRYSLTDRATPEELLRQVNYFATVPQLLDQFLNAIPDILTVLNRQRQIVFANRRLLEYLNTGLTNVIGLRPGEAINCVHAFETECGCGTTEFCTTCGAFRAILSCQRGQADAQECRIIRRFNTEALDLRIWTTPIEAEGEAYTIFAATDISSEKRRQALERIFFHDVMNAASILMGAISLLQEQLNGQPDQVVDLIAVGAEKLIEEIKAQQLLTRAENNELTLQPECIHISALLQELVVSYRSQQNGQARELRLAQPISDMQLVSDPVLLRRVIGNMLKNAVEASQPGQVITLGCTRQTDHVEIWVHNPTSMPRHVQLQVFQRSFSTKGAGRGLGTYSMKLLGERYLQGRITFSSSEEGTTFRFCCPLDIAPATQPNNGHQ